MKSAGPRGKTGPAEVAAEPLRFQDSFSSNPAEGKTEIISDLSPTTLYLLAAPSTPEDIGKEVIADIEAGKPVGDRQVKARIQEAANRLARSKLIETFEERAQPPPVVEVEAPKPKKPRKPTRAQLEKRKKRLEQAIGFHLMARVESIDLGFFSPTGDHLHSDDYYPAACKLRSLQKVSPKSSYDKKHQEPLL